MTKENDIVGGYTKAKADNIEEILKEVCNESGFLAGEVINKSKWWNSDQVGAIHYSGQIDGKDSVLKLQLVKIDSSEVSLINAYHKANNSEHVRAPFIYFHQEWDDTKNYEAIIMEKVEKRPVVNYPTTNEEIDQFHFFYTEYKTKTNITKPWVVKPIVDNISEVINTKFDKWRGMRQSVAKNWQAITSDDEILISLGIEKICTGYTNNLDLEFCHSHFGPQDLSKIDDTHAIVFSNLYWAWKSKYYDLIFGYHYFKFFMASTDEISEKDYNLMTKYWFDKAIDTARSLGDFDETLFNLAYLERLIAGLNLDFINIEASKPNVKTLLNNTRQEISEVLTKI